MSAAARDTTRDAAAVAGAGASTAPPAPRDHDPDPCRHLGLAIRIARAEWARCPARRMDLEDFEQEAMLALCDAATRYDPALGRFPTYAGATVAAHLKGVRQRALRLVRFGSHDLSGKIRRELRRWPFDRPINAETVGAALGRKIDLTDEQAHRAVGYAVGCEVGFEDLKTPEAYDAEELIADDAMGEGMGGEEEALDALVGAAWERLLAAFRERVGAEGTDLERAVFDRRLLGDDGDGARDEAETLAAIGRSAGVSRERARQIEARLLIELRARAQRAGLLMRDGQWGEAVDPRRRRMARSAQGASGMDTLTDTSLDGPAAAGPWAENARDLFLDVLRGRHHEEARRALRWAHLCPATQVDQTLIVMAPDFAAVSGLYGCDDVGLPGVRTRGLVTGEVTLYAVPLDHLTAALGCRWRKDLPAIVRTYGEALGRGEEVGVLLTRVRSVVVTLPRPAVAQGRVA